MKELAYFKEIPDVVDDVGPSAKIFDGSGWPKSHASSPDKIGSTAAGLRHLFLLHTNKTFNMATMFQTELDKARSLPVFV